MRGLHHQCRRHGRFLRYVRPWRYQSDHRRLDRGRGQLFPRRGTAHRRRQWPLDHGERRHRRRRELRRHRRIARQDRHGHTDARARTPTPAAPRSTPARSRSTARFASPVTVNAGGTLGGTGTITNPVTLNANGTLAPGLSVGTLNTGPVAFKASVPWRSRSTARAAIASP